MVDRNLALLRALDLTNGVEAPATTARPATWDLPTFDLAGTEIGAMLATIPEGRRVAVLNPGTTWATKIWAQERFAEVANAFVDHGFEVVITWAGDVEAAMADRIVSLNERAEAQPSSPARQSAVRKAPPTSLMELRGLLQRAAILVANDSGPAASRRGGRSAVGRDLRAHQSCSQRSLWLGPTGVAHGCSDAGRSGSHPDRGCDRRR